MLPRPSTPPATLVCLKMAPQAGRLVIRLMVWAKMKPMITNSAAAAQPASLAQRMSTLPPVLSATAYR